MTIDEPEEGNVTQENTMPEENAIKQNEFIDEKEENIIENTNGSENEIIEEEIELEKEDDVGHEIQNSEIINEELEIENPQNIVSNEVSSRANETRQIQENNNIPNSEQYEKDEFVNEEEMIQKATKQVIQETYEELTAKDFEIEITKENEIKVQNIIYATKIEIEIEYLKKEAFDVTDLYKQTDLQLKGTFINLDLEKISVETQQEISVGWKDEKEFDLFGEYTKVSTFRLGEHTGSVVESKIKISRNIEENYLPIKQTTIEIEVPDFYGNKPESVSVQATKLMATKGEDLGEISFGEQNWNYDEKNQKIIITITNENNGFAVNTVGEDEFLVVYRYNDDTGHEKVALNQNFEVTLEEYCAKQNQLKTKKWNQMQEIKTQQNDLITYHIGTTQEKLKKAKINANYNQEEAIYKSEFTTTVNVDILTSELLEELKIDSSKEMYLDSNLAEFDATQDIYYNKIKFHYPEIKKFLQNGATVEIQTLSGELLYTLKDELVQNEESCEIRFSSKEKGIFVVLKNVSVNGNLSIEFTKAIGKSNYDKATFCNFKKVKSCVLAQMKYANHEAKYEMSEISVTKEFQESKTVAEISLSNPNLTTIAKNDGVELKIALNNDKQDSDLYCNPSFELVFPKYVKKVSLENMSLIYKCDLRIADYEIYTENEIVKMRIDLEGIQTRFSDCSMTNGTNLLLNLNMELDEYTPKKQDQIKLYYYNEGVTNYESQTKWTMAKEIPQGIQKDTNGFDVAIVNYQAPNGFITSNAIVNYDGQASKIKSIAQGKRTAQMDVYQNAQIATMELVAMNNTENTCSEIVFLGRIPFKGNKSVITGQDLGSTVTTTMLSGINENIQNANMTTIYYSENESATQNLADSKNDWKTNITDWRNIKSYMIVVKGQMPAGAILKYSYDFEIPQNLYYDEAMYGSFGGFFNNHSQMAVDYDSTEADKVGIVSKSSLPIKLTLEADIDYQEEIQENRYLNYNLTVKNEGEETYSGIKINAPAPNGTYICEFKDYANQGNNGYVASLEQTKEWTIDTLEPGSSRQFSYVAKTNQVEESNFVIENQASMTIESLDGKQIWSNQLKNKLVDSIFDIEVSSLSGKALNRGSKLNYRTEIANVTDKDSGKFVLTMKVPEGLKYNSVFNYSEEINDNFDENTRILTISFDNLAAKTGIVLETDFTVMQNDEKMIHLQPEIKLENGEVETSTGTDFSVQNAEVKINTSFDFDNTQIAENQEIEMIYTIKSMGQMEAQNMQVKCELSEFIENAHLYKECNSNGNVEQFDDDLTQNHLEDEFGVLPVDTYIQYRITGKVKNVDCDMENIKLSTMKVQGQNFETMENEIKVAKIKDLGNNQQQEQIQQEQGNYEISGNVFVDEGQVNPEEAKYKSVDSVQVQLIKDGDMVKATTTDGSGNYKFTGLTKGNYSIVYNYDKESYMARNFIQNETEENAFSNGYEVENGKAVSNEVVISDENIENVNLELQEKEKFDFRIQETISKVIVDVQGEQMVYEYADLDLAKVEIEPNKVDKAKVKFEYKITVQNVGNVAGKVTSIVDYLPVGMYFLEAENQGWTNGVDGNLYNETLKDVMIYPGETQELKLVLAKQFNENNLGVLSNKVKIAYTENDVRLTESKAGNFATQETIVTVTQGGNLGLKVITVTISILSVIAIFAYMIKTGKIEIRLDGRKWIKKVYK